MNVLLSCMYQKDLSILNRSNINSNVIVVNQCDKDIIHRTQWINELSKNQYEVLFISTTDRGLSKSRNRAIENALDDICLISDDDEIFYDNYSKLISDTFFNNPDADVIAFQIDNAGKKYPKKKRRIGYFGALKLASWQIAFKRNRILSNNIRFDETLGSGVSKAGGEENMFIYDCLRKGLKVIFVPISIGEMIPNESKWFHGFTKDYFFDRGKMTKKLMGKFMASIYAGYFLLRKYPQYKNDIKFLTASRTLFKGIYEI